MFFKRKLKKAQISTISSKYNYNCIMDIVNNWLESTSDIEEQILLLDYVIETVKADLYSSDGEIIGNVPDFRLAVLYTLAQIKDDIRGEN